MIDTEPILRLAQHAADSISEHADDDDGGFIRQVLVSVEIDLGSSTTILSFSADDRPWVQIAFLDEAASRLEAQRYALQQDNED